MEVENRGSGLDRGGTMVDLCIKGRSGAPDAWSVQRIVVYFA